MEIVIPLTGGVEAQVIAKNSVFRFSFLIYQPKIEQKMWTWSKWQKKIVWTTILSFRRKKNNKKNQNLMLQWLKHSPTIGNYEIAQSRTENIWYLLSRITNQLCHDSVH